MTPHLLAFAASVLAGLAFGALHLLLLRVGTRALARPQATRLFVGLAMLRAALLVAALAGMAAFGAGAIEFVGALAGFLLARLAAIRAVRAGKGASWR